MSTAQLTAELSYLKDNGYHTITPQQYLDWIEGTPANLPSNPILLVADNGIDNFLAGAQSILQADGFTMAVSVVTGFADGASGVCPEPTYEPGCPTDNVDWDATWAQLRALNPSVYNFILEAGTAGHFVQDYDPNCTVFYACMVPGETTDAYEARVESDVSNGESEIVSELGASRFTKGVWVVPYSDDGYTACTESSCTSQSYDGPPGWLTSWTASTFPVAFVEDAFRNGVQNERFRIDVQGWMTESEFQTTLTQDLAASDFALTGPPPSPATVPGAPTQSAPSAVGNGTVTLNWSAPTSGASTVTGYDVYEGTSSGGESTSPVNTSPLPSSATSYTLTGLTNNTTYYFTIEAINTVGNSEPSNQESATPSIPAPSPAPNPVALWELADPAGSTTAADSSGNGYTGTVYGSVTFGEPGPTTSATAALFDGSTGYITTPAAPSGHALSIAAWVDVTPTSSITYPRVVSCENYNDDTGAYLGIADGPSGASNVFFDLGNGTGYTEVDSNSALSSGWHYLIGTWNGSTMDLYVDGSEVGSSSFSGIDWGTEDWTIGTDAGSLYSHFSGYLADVAIYSSALSVS